LYCNPRPFNNCDVTDSRENRRSIDNRHRTSGNSNGTYRSAGGKTRSGDIGIGSDNRITDLSRTCDACWKYNSFCNNSYRANGTRSRDACSRDIRTRRNNHGANSARTLIAGNIDNRLGNNRDRANCAGSKESSGGYIRVSSDNNRANFTGTGDTRRQYDRFSNDRYRTYSSSGREA